MTFWNNEVFRGWLKLQEQMQTYVRQFNNLSKGVEPFVLDSATTRSLVSMQKTLGNVSLPPLSYSPLSGIYGPLATSDVNLLKQIQSMNTSWLEQIQLVIPPDQLQILRNQATTFDGMARKMAALGQVAVSLPNVLLTAWESTSTALQHFALFHQSVLNHYTAEAVRDNVALVEASIIPPTFTTAALVDVMYGLVEDHLAEEAIRENKDLEDSSRFLPSSLKEYDIKSTVEVLLAQVGQRFVNKWNGAWEVMASGHSDHQSQAAHSGRELLMQLLAELAPDAEFPGEEKITRKMRVKHILEAKKSHTVDLINGFANTIDSMHDVLCGEAHRRNESVHDDTTIVGYFYALGSMITILLTYPRQNIGEQE